MSNWYVASEENLEALQHYGVKGMKWKIRRTHKAVGGESALSGFKYGENAAAMVKQGMPLYQEDVVPLKDKEKRTSTYYSSKSKDKKWSPTYMTKDAYGHTITANSKAELDKINEQKKKDKKEELKKKFKNLTDRIKNTAKGLGK